jgi:uncharacterized protein YndB with AHSA1/START domain
MAAGLSTGPAPADRVLVITRVLDAPRSLVFKAWTDREHLARWYGPKGFTLTSCKIDLRPGGSYRYCMRSPEGTDHWLQGVYREIVEPEKLVCTYAWADANGNATRPETVLALTFAEQDGKTALTLHQSVFESVTACDMHRQGWTSSLDCLADYLAKAD